MLEEKPKTLKISMARSVVLNEEFDGLLEILRVVKEELLAATSDNEDFNIEITVVGKA